MRAVRRRVLFAAWVALVLLVLLVRARVARAQLLSPGPLSASHASIEGDAHCSDCHSSGKRVDQGACLKCHGDVGATISAGTGLHGRPYKGKACEGCHVEHLGKGIVRWDPNKLDHAQTGWALEGAHAKVACAKCHNKTNKRGAATFLGAPTACVSCHKDIHQDRFGKTCTTCHDQVSFQNLNLKTFNHDQARFPLRGAHPQVACAKCHFEPPKYVGLKFDGCASCHKDVHGGKLGTECTNCHEDTKWKPVSFRHGSAKHPGVSLANGHSKVACKTCHDKGNLVVPSRGTECSSCHKPSHKAPFGRACASCHASILWMKLPRAIGRTAHARTQYPLTGKHDSVDCAGCHKPSLPREERYRKLAFGRCGDCHADQHKGEFAAKDHGECGPCHGTAGFAPTRFGTLAHASTSFPLVGKHNAAPCSSCHTAPRPRLVLKIAKQACVDCHKNPHGTQFAKEMAAGGCAHCHEPNGWNMPKIDHRTWPLTGAHATTSCERCHHPTAEDRKAAQGASYRGVPRNCGGCHDDTHLGQFRLTQPALECSACHTTAAFKIPTFDHQAMARWALTGAHAKTSCAKCHPMTNLTQGSKTIRWRLPSQECTFCHANPHEPRRVER